MSPIQSAAQVAADPFGSMGSGGAPPQERAVLAGGHGPGASRALAAAAGGEDVVRRRFGELVLAFRAQDASLFEEEGRVVLVHGRLISVPEEAGQDALRSPARLLWERLSAGGQAHFRDRVLPGLRGSFVLVAWDAQRGTGLIARDQLGDRPLCYTSSPGGLVFASEVRDLLELVPTPPEPDATGLAHWLALEALPAGCSLFRDIRRLPPAHVLELDRAGWRERRYWAPWEGQTQVRDLDEAAEALRPALTRAVSRRLRAPVTGVLLSGGLDSSAVAGHAARARADAEAEVRTYSALFSGLPSIDESAAIGSVVEELGLPNTAVDVEAGSLLRGAADYVRAWRLPPSSPNLFFWLPLLRRAAAEGARVMLDGEGGDELFGAARYLPADRVRAGRPLAGLELIRRMPGAGAATPAHVRGVFLRSGALGALPASLHSGVRALGRGGATELPWLRPALRRELDSFAGEWGWKRLPGPRWRAQLGWALLGPHPSLAREHVHRRNAIAGLEAAHPLLDVDVIELVFSFDPELAFDPQFSRAVLRRSMAGLVPEQVRLRARKSSFDALFQRTLYDTDLPACRDLLGDDAELAAYLDPARLRRELLDIPPRDFRFGAQSWAVLVWRHLSAEWWLRSLAGRLPEGAQLDGRLPHTRLRTVRSGPSVPAPQALPPKVAADSRPLTAGTPVQASVPARSHELLRAARTLEIDRVSAEIVASLAGRGIRAILLKGPSLASWLWRDAVRPYGDTDLLVAPGDRAQAQRALAALGFSAALGALAHPGIDAHQWVRAVDGHAVDLHLSLWGLGADPEQVWAELSSNTAQERVGGRELEVLALVPRALHVALHAAQHGAEAEKSLIDLRGAIAALPLEGWREVVALARRLDGAAVLASGLRLVPEGELLTERLDLEREHSVEALLRARPVPLAQGLEQLWRAPGLRAKGRLLARELFPTPAFMRWRMSLARRGRVGLAAAYAWRLLWLTVRLPHALMAWVGAHLRSPRRLAP